jgi:hypothetical protein
MCSRLTIPASLIGLLCLASCRTPGVDPGRAAEPAPTVGAIQQENDETARRVLARIVGKETLPAGQVFQNVKFLENVPAGTFVLIMNQGYARALGVRCTHCHVEGNFASDDKRPKRAAREMQVMHRMINQQLAAMQNIETPPTANRAINCATCHRGAVIPRER